MVNGSEEESFRSTVRKEAGRASLYTLSSFIIQLGNFLLLPLFWHRLTPADFGVIGVAEILFLFFGSFWGLSLEMSVSRFYYEWPEEERAKRLGALWVLSWTSSLVLGAVTILLLRFLNPILFPNIAFFPYIVLGITHGILVRMRQLTFYTIRIKQLQTIYFVYSLMILLSSVLSNLLFVWYLDLKLLGFFIAWNVSELILLIACVVLMLRFATLNISRKGLRESLAFALPLIPNSLISSLSSLSDRYLLQRFASLEALGIYTLCVKFTNIINVVHEALKMSFAPFIFKSVSEEGPAAASKIGRIRMLYLLPILVTGLAIAYYTRDFVRIIDQKAYLPVGEYVPLLVGPAVMLTFFMYFASGLLLSKQTKLVFIPSLVHVVFILAGGVVFIPWLQMDGMILNRYIAVVAYLVVGVLLSEKYFPVPLNAKKLTMLCLVFFASILLAKIRSGHSVPVALLYDTIAVFAFSALYAVIVIGPSTFIREVKSRLVRKRRETV